MRLFCTLIIAAFIPGPVLQAQQVNIGFEQYTTAGGLSANNSNSILQDSRGFLWIGSTDGLTRYDGRSFKKYITLGRNGLTDLSIVCLAEDDEGNIWIGTQNGLNKLDPFSETITHYYEGTGPGTIPFKWCNYLYADRNKQLWLSTERGLALYDKSSNSFQNFPVAVYGKDVRINKFISKILEDHRGRFWLATSYGIKLFDRQTKTYQSFYYEDDQQKESISYPIMSIREDNEGHIWAGTWGGGLLKLNENEMRFEKQSVGDTRFESFVIFDILQINPRSGNFLLLSTNKGLLLLNAAGAMQLSPLSLRVGTNNLFRDRQENIWVSAETGLYKMNMNSLAWQWISLPGNEKDPPVIFHIIPDIKDPGKIFYLSTVAGWWRYDDVTKAITAVKLPNDPTNLLGGINDWMADENGYWFTSVKGFGYYDLIHNRLLDMGQLTGARSPSTPTGLVIKDRTNKLWISLHRNGILIYDPVAKTSSFLFNDKTKADNAVGDDIHDLKLAPDGYIYFTLRNALYKVDITDHSYKVFNAPVSNDSIDANKISPDKMSFSGDGRFFIRSRLQVYEFKHDKLATVYPEKGYPPFAINKIYCTQNDAVWANTSDGIFKTDTGFKKWININTRLGWPEDEQINDIYTGKPGEILFAGKGKLAVLQDFRLKASVVPPPVIISRIKYGEKENYMVSLKSSEIRSSYRSPVEIEIAAVNFINEKENKIMYQLDGWDKEWKELSGISIVRYEQLPPGDYTFTVKQVNAEGVSGKPTSISFSILPPFYSTWWFIVSLIALIACILYIAYRYRLKKALEIEKLRTRIATDLHDDIGATLSSISMYSDVVKQQVREKLPHLEPIMDKIGENSRDMVSSMSDIVWAINPNNDNGSKLLHRIENYALDLCSVKNIRLHFRADPGISNLILPLEYRKNIYLIFKESLNNALKYASAKNIWIDIIIKNGQFKMTLHDDGLGFITALTSAGNGLNNIRERAKEIKGEAGIDSVIGKGTTISLICQI